MIVIADGTTWTPRLQKLFDEHPNIDVGVMGFPDGWAELKFWSLPDAKKQ